MKELPIAELIPGMITASDVYNYNHQIVLPKGIVLTDQSITRLEFYSLNTILVEDKIPDVIPNFMEDKSYRQKIMESPAFSHFKHSFESTLNDFEDTVSEIILKNDVTGFEYIWDMFEALSSNTSSHFILAAMQNLRHYDDVTFAHSLNVGLICSLLSKWLNFSVADQKTAVMCGLLHDIGKLEVSEDIIKKPSKLTTEEFAQIKTHPTKGYNILCSFNIDEHIKNAALMHHEKCDGSGYPQQLTSDQIDPFAKLVAIVDVYDAMTSARIYRGPLCPFHVIEIFEQEGFQKYDAEYILTFLNNVVTTYINDLMIVFY